MIRNDASPPRKVTNTKVEEQLHKRSNHSPEPDIENARIFLELEDEQKCFPVKDSNNNSIGSINFIDDEEHVSSVDRTCYLLLKHGGFFIGAALGTISSVLNLHMAQLDAKEYPEDSHSKKQDDFYAQPFYGPLGIIQLFDISSFAFYFLDAVVHVCLLESPAENFWHRCSMILFGAAAFSQLLSSAIHVDTVRPSEHPLLDLFQSALDFLGAYLFFGSAITNLLQNRGLCFHWQKHKIELSGAVAWKSWMCGRALAEFLGDILFLLATLIDVVVVQLEYDGETNTQYRDMARWSLFSAVVWQTDSIIYLFADILSPASASKPKREKCGKATPQHSKRN